jgi:hypothetical protein
VLSNSVSSRSNKLCAYNTISKAIETFWTAGPVTQADIESQAAWLVSAWDSLVSVRPEFGVLSTPARQAVRAKSVAGSGVSIHAVIAALSGLFVERVDPAVALKQLEPTPNESDDFFSFDNPAWTKAGVIVPSTNSKGGPAFTVRTSYPTRRSAARILADKIGVRAPSSLGLAGDVGASEAMPPHPRGASHVIAGEVVVGGLRSLLAKLAWRDRSGSLEGLLAGGLRPGGAAEQLLVANGVAELAD